MDGYHQGKAAPRVLWGRVAFYAVSLVLVFALGMWAGGDDTADAELEEARAEIERLSQENMHLRAENEALEAGDALDAEEAGAGEEDDPGGEEQAGGGDDAAGTAAGPDSDEPAGQTAGGQESAGSDGDRRTYVVRDGDTGHAIAEQVYGDRDLWPLIEEANQLDDSALQVDQELVIPPPG